jgi:hypothetical protein
VLYHSCKHCMCTQSGTPAGRVTSCDLVSPGGTITPLLGPSDMRHSAWYSGSHTVTPQQQETLALTQVSHSSHSSSDCETTIMVVDTHPSALSTLASAHQTINARLTAAALCLHSQSHAASSTASACFPTQCTLQSAVKWVLMCT